MMKLQVQHAKAAGSHSRQILLVFAGHSQLQ